MTSVSNVDRKKEDADEDDVSTTWSFIEACETARHLFRNFVYDPGEPGVDRSGPDSHSVSGVGGSLAVNRRFSGAGGTQNVLLYIAPQELWEALSGMQVAIWRQKTSEEVGVATIGKAKFIEFENVRVNTPYVFRLKGILEDNSQATTRAP